MMTKQLTLAAALSIAVLTGCSNSADDAAPPITDESAAVVLPKDEPMPAPTTEPAIPIETMPATVNAVDELPPEEMPAPDEQMLDDAAATGMTARSTREEPAAEDTAPAERE